MLAAILLAICCSHPANAADLRPEAFGFSTRIVNESDGSRVVILEPRDGNGPTLRQVYSPLGTLEEEEVLSRGGVLLERFRVMGGLAVRERFVPTRQVIEIRATGADTAEVTYGDWSTSEGRWLTRSGRMSLVPAQGCLKKIMMSEAPKYLSGVSKLTFSPQAATASGDVPIGNNFVTHGCGTYGTGAAATTGLAGAAGVAADVNDGLSKVLKCMVNDIGPSNPDVKLAAARVLAFMDPTYSSRAVRIECATPPAKVTSYTGTVDVLPGDTARGTLCPHPSYPTVVVNLTKANAGSGRINSSIVHEMLHIAGYPHTEGMDMPYLAITCCSPYETAGKSVACGILKTPSQDWKSAGYLGNYMSYQYLNRNQPQETTVHVLSSLNAQDALAAPEGSRRNGRPLYDAVMGPLAGSIPAGAAAGRDGGRAMYAMIMGGASLEHLPQDASINALNSAYLANVVNKYYPLGTEGFESRRGLGLTLGKIIGTAARTGAPGIAGLAKQYEGALNTACVYMSAQEKSALAGAIEGARLANSSTFPAGVRECP